VTRTTTSDAVVVRSYLGPGDERSLADDVLDGLTRPFKEIQPKHFYDTRGGDLYDRITELPEYYPARTEAVILETRASEALAEMGAAEIVELGSGTATKTRILLRALHDAGTLERFVPMDVTEGLVRSTAEAWCSSSAARSATSRPGAGGASCAASPGSCAPAWTGSCSAPTS
jgi:L-histidine Nalpha-methyltransferase